MTWLYFLRGTVILLMIDVWWFSEMVCIMMVYVMFATTSQKPSAILTYYRRITWPTSRCLQNYDMTFVDSQYDKAEISDHLKYLDQINGDSVNKICSQNSVGRSACSMISETSNPTIRSGLDYVSMTCCTDDKSVDKKENISILAWNINGLSQDKSNDAILGLLLKRHDIISLNETWAANNNEYQLEGFTYYNYPSKSKHLKSKRESGGLGIFIRHDIHKGVSLWSHTDNIVAWIILKKTFFGFRNDVYLANIYIVPEGSTYLKHDEFNLLYEEILNVADNSEVLLCGDYNARTGVKLEFDVHFSGCNGDLNDLLPPDDGGVYYMIESMHRNRRLLINTGLSYLICVNQLACWS